MPAQPHSRMRAARTIAVVVAALAALVLAACNTASPSTGRDAGPSLWTVARGVDLPASPTDQRMRKRGRVVVGVQNDQPGLGVQDPLSGRFSGLDIDVARWIAASLGFRADQIEFRTIPAANREQAIVNGDIDFDVGTYSITDARKQLVAFAGPYLVTGQSLLVAATNTDIHGPRDLAGKIVCAVTGSTSLQRIRKYHPGDTVEYDSYAQCLEQLKAGTVDAVTTDQAVLAGYVALDPRAFKLVGPLFSVERYGVGLRKGDTALTDHIDQLFAGGGAVLRALFDEYLAPSGVFAEQPAIDRSSQPKGRSPFPPAARAGAVSVVTNNLDVWRDALVGTVKLFFAGGALALLLGTIVAAMRVSPVPIARGVGALYVATVRNTPLTLVFFAFAFVLPPLLDLRLTAGVSLVLGVCALGVYSATYVAETIRAGIGTVPVGQAEAARALGLTFGQVMSLVVLPQAFRSVVPPMMSVFIGLLKNTTVAAGFSIMNLGSVRSYLSERGADPLFVILWVLVLFVALVLALSWVQRSLEKRWRAAR